ncbi:hypothetical protein B7P43_G12313 [Cryptotermes secundus]|uniref:Uncharacterized protein n=1 Tax=Cryptotermes secundus TaxID=105785 RepID=A0A2J7RL22_9NEOP|nr:hypothetical protein B7P43_G12313 [Cryptotermes secundus]
MQKQLQQLLSLPVVSLNGLEAKHSQSPKLNWTELNGAEMSRSDSLCALLYSL